MMKHGKPSTTRQAPSRSDAGKLSKVAVHFTPRHQQTNRRSEQLAASGADGAEALRLIIAAINSINRLEPLGEREEKILHAKSNPSPELWDNPDMYYSVLSFPCLKKPVSFLCLTCCLQTSCFLSHAAVDLQLYRFDKEF
ncbi:Hypothetical protein SMAX5B_004286 [Scophthalmus maximus]|uniref:Uncharacterized protein n=1 Tax=Scophthalmus maximus TaxID=52904 RepID=A0A2U9B9F9_SCOMX|nr:Hypothetical protein SMAX5B_004286 [Scophthalmus maximus]